MGYIANKTEENENAILGKEDGISLIAILVYAAWKNLSASPSASALLEHGM